jgi:thiamine biosynthesis lipoprotein
MAGQYRRRRRFLLDAGGDIVASGSAPGRSWTVGIEDPAGGTEPVAVVTIRDRGTRDFVGPPLRWERDGRALHHLIDPQFGGRVARTVAVTVAGPDPAWAESGQNSSEGSRRIADGSDCARLAAGGSVATAGWMTPVRRPTTWVGTS